MAAIGEWRPRDWETSDFPVSSFRAKREIFVNRGLRLTLSPNVPRIFPLSSAVFHAASALSAPTGHLPLEGKAGDTREACYRKPSGIAPYIFAAKPPPITLNPEP